MSKLLSTLILTAIGAVAMNAQAASHVPAAPASHASEPASHASEPATKAHKDKKHSEMKKDEEKKH